MERVWGGRLLEDHFGKDLPPATSIGESWEIVDRPEAQSLVHRGAFRGKTLHELWTDHRELLFGRRAPEVERFPLLVKILDCQEKLSVQVHPPRHSADELGGEPKTEMWYVVATGSNADLYVGLKNGVNREEFESAVQEGTVAEKIHRIETHPGDVMYLPSGRLHAIGGGNLIFEIQQNSDTTYRVFDWNRVGLDGKPRELHVEESLKSIDFNDFEPSLVRRSGELLVESEFFRVEEWSVPRPRPAVTTGSFVIVAVVEGRLACGSLEFGPGSFFLVPASAADLELCPLSEGCKVLCTSLPQM